MFHRDLSFTGSQDVPQDPNFTEILHDFTGSLAYNRGTGFTGPLFHRDLYTRFHQDIGFTRIFVSPGIWLYRDLIGYTEKLVSPGPWFHRDFGFTGTWGSSGPRSHRDLGLPGPWFHRDLSSPENLDFTWFLVSPGLLFSRTLGPICPGTLTSSL